MGLGVAIGGIGAIGSALISSSSAGDAANAQIQATNNADQTQLAMYNQTQANLQPYMQSGNIAQNRLMSLLGLEAAPNATASVPGAAGGKNTLSQYLAGLGGGTTAGFLPSSSSQYGQLTAPFNYQASPGYNYEMQQMMQAVQNGAAAKGGLNSGNTLMALQQNAQGLASTDYLNMANLNMQQNNQLFNMLQTLSGSGQNAAAHLGSLGSNTADSISNNQLAAGNASASAINAQANSLSNLLNSSAFQNGVAGMFGGGGGGGGYGGGTQFSDFSSFG